MPLDQTLRNQIQTALAGLAVTGLSHKVACDLYELFVLTIVIEAANSQGPVSIDHRNMADSPVTTLRCPTSPRAIGRGNYTHVRIAFPGKNILEAHLGIYVLGKSKVEHECDVVILSHEEAKNCRDRSVLHPNTTFHPSSASVLSFTECKCYEKTQLSISHGRAFLGLSQDVRPADVCAAFVSTKAHDQISKLLLAHKKVFGDSLKPGSANEIKWLQGKYADRFHAYKQKP